MEHALDHTTRAARPSLLCRLCLVWASGPARLGAPSVRSAAACSSVSSSARTNQQDSLVGVAVAADGFPSSTRPLSLATSRTWPICEYPKPPRAYSRLSAFVLLAGPGPQIRHNGTFHFNLLATTTREGIPDTAKPPAGRCHLTTAKPPSAGRCHHNQTVKQAVECSVNIIGAHWPPRVLLDGRSCAIPVFSGPDGRLAHSIL
ncbi:hypothetical protein PVAP13_3KG175081 [Panicum virgatum]|uniref:Uncharacterized protein n=1 Tax=Panicum virgatum TaxID=38727 RepID=A0A8T0UVL9_PANVG|nr:hypothetical protein PVAP13_3KG175081 [Panicum virgatum]